MTGFTQDLHYAIRQLRQHKGFTAIAILTLAIGIGANSALFSVVNGVLLSPLPYPHSDELVSIQEKTPAFSESSISYPNFLDWRRENHSFDSLAVYNQIDFNLTGAGEARRVKGIKLSATFFSMLGVNPVLGRNFTAEEDQKGAAPVVMLSGEFWKRTFGASRDILGKALILDGDAYTIVGVLPDNFYFCCEESGFPASDIYIPIGSWNNPDLYQRAFHMGLHGVGRIKPGMSVEQARADMDRVAHDLSLAYPDVNKEAGITLSPLKEHMVKDVRAMLLVLLAAVGFVLLIACGNVANLLLARATGRAREFAIRAALGASRKRVIRQLLTESILLAAVGGAFGLLLASWGTRAALAALPQTLPHAGDVHLDPRVLMFTIGISVLAGAIFGLAPALKSARTDLQDTLKEGGRGSSSGRYRTLGIFVIAEMALAVVLLTGAGLTIRSLVHLWSVDPGFNPQNVTEFSVSLPPSVAKASPPEIRASFHQLLDTVAAVPRVKSVALTEGSLLMEDDNDWPFWLEGQPKPATQSEMPQSLVYIVSPDYLKVMQIPLLAGRFVTPQDDERSPIVGVIDEDFARQHFPGRDPIGQHINFAFDDLKVEIVGIARHVNQWGLDSDSNGPIRSQLYISTQQMSDKYMPSMARGGDLVVRTDTPDHASAQAMRAAVENIRSGEITYDFRSLNKVVADSIASRRFMMILLSAFAVIALLLASIGIYGVISYMTGQRTHEIGTRLALGARRIDVLRLVIGQGAKLAFTGVILGAVSALALTRLMASLLFGVTAHDPLTFVAVAVLLAAVALLACYIPARRASKVDPMVALRYE